MHTLHQRSRQEADDLLDITGMLTPQEQTAYTSQPVSPPPHSPVYTSQPVSPPPHSPTAVPSPATSTPVLPPLAPPLPSRLPSPMPLPPQEHPPQVLPYGAPWTPLVEQAIPQPHTEGGGARSTVFAGWGEGGAELTREITVPAPQARRPTPRRPLDALRTPSMCQPRVMDSGHDDSTVNDVRNPTIFVTRIATRRRTRTTSSGSGSRVGKVQTTPARRGLWLVSICGVV